MISEKLRFYAKSGDLWPGLSRWQVADWDTNRWIWVEGPEELLGNDEGETACEVLRLFADDLPENVTKVIVSADKRLKSIITDSEWDSTLFLPYPRFTTKEVGKDAFDCLKRSQLKEIDRLYPCLDLVTLKDDPSSRFVFKYGVLDGLLKRIWGEAFLVNRLKGCAHIVPFHKYIVDDVEPQFLGFTMDFVSGDTWLDLEERRRPFRKDWLRQLLETVDNLNLNYGIIHQDIAPRNLIIDSVTDSLVLIDFGLATEIGSEHEFKPRNDIDGVLYTVYEVLTHDKHFRWEVHPRDYNIEDVTSMKEWPLKAVLEPGLDARTLRSMTMDWVNNRRRMNSKSNAWLQESLRFPPIPPPRVDGVENAQWGLDTDFRLRRDAPPWERIVRWERPPAKRLLASRPDRHDNKHLRIAPSDP